MIRFQKRFLVACVCTASTVLGAGFAAADPETPPPQPASDPPQTSIELNKLEPADKGCRAYLVVNNAGDKSYQSFKIDLVLFQNDGVIGKRFSIDLAPLKPKKKSVKLFDIDGIACDKIGSFLINDVMECKAGDAPVDNCLQGLSTSTLTKVQLSK